MSLTQLEKQNKEAARKELEKEMEVIQKYKRLLGDFQLLEAAEDEIQTQIDDLDFPFDTGLV